jgi:hypothetical protein
VHSTGRTQSVLESLLLVARRQKVFGDEGIIEAVAVMPVGTRLREHPVNLLGLGLAELLANRPRKRSVLKLQRHAAIADGPAHKPIVAQRSHGSTRGATHIEPADGAL